MIKCHLSRLLGERRLKISDVASDTGINRGTLTRLYHETAERVDLSVIGALCDYLEIDVGELLENIPSAKSEENESRGPRRKTRSPNKLADR